MTGVEILNQWEVVTDTVFSWKSAWIGFAFGAVAAILISLLVMLDDFDWSCFGWMCLITIPILGIIIGLFSGFLIAPTPIEYETRYEVSITEEVNMKEFMDKYEILDTRGSIYTVREKETN